MLAYTKKLNWDDARIAYDGFRESMRIVHNENWFYWNIPEFREICKYNNALNFRDISNFSYERSV